MASLLQAVNTTIESWTLSPLPSNATLINSTLVNGTTLFGCVYNGTTWLGEECLAIFNNTLVIERGQGPSVGSISLVSFIYMIMSLIIIITQIPALWDFTTALAGRPHRYKPGSAGTTFSERDFKKALLTHYPPAPIVPPLPSHLELLSHNPGENITSQQLRDFRSLIRAKYMLDVQAYNLRDVFHMDRPIVDDMHRRSRGALEDMKRTVQEWVNEKEQWSAEEWRMVEEICRRVQELAHPRAHNHTIQQNASELPP
ncbi:hypothetical protein K469DRAFT_716740 [Zopfia rhizophila CBS 207.26]|uniref:Uncharacterized protein n=1 Tax=Zopfia rhizophila CBS 207.26 TaxID=1314779 RepID=A0A6A6EQ72_9PEZI|nr:hypothetical protein K469DRAFT_716740 [Zopfia rhizophila CBS 207.26]